MRGGPGGRGGRGGQGRGNPWKNMVNKFIEKLGVELPEGTEKAKKIAQEWGFAGARCEGGGWKKQRALLVSKPDGVLEARPG